MKKLLKRLMSTVFVFAVVLILGTGTEAASMTATAASDTEMSLSWTAINGSTTYNIYRGDLSTLIDTIDVATAYYTTSYTDSGLVPSTSYTYYVQGYSGTTLLGTYSASASTLGMLAPAGLSAIYDVNAGTVSLSWINQSAATAGNKVYYVSGGTYTEPSTVTYTTSSAIVYNVAVTGNAVGFAAASYYDATITSGYSSMVSITPISAPTLSAVNYSGTISLSWNSFSQISSFTLERAHWNGTSWDSWTTINSSLSGTSTTDSPTAGGSYKYRLSGKSSAANPYSGYSNETGVIYLPVLTAGITSATTVLLSWNADTSGTWAGYKIYRGTGSGALSLVATLASTVSTYTDTLTIVSGTTYVYQLAAYTSGGGTSYSSTTSVSTSAPAAPSGLVATVESSDAVVLSWTDNSSNETAFYLERMQGTGGTYLPLPSSDEPALDANTTTYTDSTVELGVTYTYRIRAYNMLGYSSYSSTVSVTASSSVAPTSLTATVVSATQINLIWTYKDSGSYSTIVERRVAGSTAWSTVATASYGVLKYNDSGLTANTQYYYRVRKFVSTSVSTVPYPNNTTGVGAMTLLTSPTLTVTAYQSNMMLLTWAGNTSSADTIIERKLSNGSFAVMSTQSYTTTSWYDSTGLVAKAVYTYRVKFKTATNESAYSPEVSAAYLYLNAPTELTAAVYETSTGLTPEGGAKNPDSIRLTWTDNSNNETGFQIWKRAYGTSTYALYETVNKNVTTYTDTKVTAGVQYYYIVRAYISSISLYSSYTEDESAGINIVTPPSNLHYTYSSSTSVILAWTDNSTNESNFIIQRKVGTENEWSDVLTASSNTVTYTVTGLSANYIYTYRIKAVNSTGNYDSYSNEVMVSTSLPVAPSALAAAAVSTSQVNLSWKDNAVNETSYQVFRRADGALDMSKIVELQKDTSSYMDRTVQQGIKYYYVVKAINSVGTAASSVAEVTTASNGSFSDVSEGFWAKEAIENLAGRGVIAGKTPVSFVPNDKITRAEFTALIIRAFKLDEGVPTGNMTDVRTGSWYYGVVMTAENLGIVSGDQYGKFYPNQNITREEMAVIICRTLNVVNKGLEGYSNSVLEDFWDASLISPYAVSSVATVVGNGVMKGLPGNSIAAGNTTTRAEAATVIFRIIDR